MASRRSQTRTGAALLGVDGRASCAFVPIWHQNSADFDFQKYFLRKVLNSSVFASLHQEFAGDGSLTIKCT
jgi:hypothetical protein